MSDLTYIESLNKKHNFRKAEWCNWCLEGTKGREKEIFLAIFIIVLLLLIF